MLPPYAPKMAEKKVSLKLLVDTNAQKVLFAEAGKEFVDFLFHIFSLPLGTVVNLVTRKGMVGCLGDLSQSIEALNSDCLQPNVTKDSVLKPAMGTSGVAVRLPLMLLSNVGNVARDFYRCSSQFCKGCENYVTDFSGTLCPRCKGQMSTPVSYVVPAEGSGGGYVTGVVSYMVMDNLEVKPMSTISGITFISKFNVKDVNCLAEKEVRVGLTEVGLLLFIWISLLYLKSPILIHSARNVKN